MLLTEAQYAYLAKEFFPRKRYSFVPALMLEVIFNVLKNGNAWRSLPKGSPPRSTVFYHFQRLGRNGLLDRLLKKFLRQLRLKQGRPPHPTALVIDSQSITTCCGGEEIGYDGNKKIKGRKRHLLTDTEGNPVSIFCTAANCHDTEAAIVLVENVISQMPQVRVVFADGGYFGQLIDYSVDEFDVNWINTKRSDTTQFKIEPKRWVVERTFAWYKTYRRLANDYEKTLYSTELWIKLRNLIYYLKNLG